MNKLGVEYAIGGAIENLEGEKRKYESIIELENNPYTKGDYYMRLAIVEAKIQAYKTCRIWLRTMEEVENCELFEVTK